MASSNEISTPNLETLSIADDRRTTTIYALANNLLKDSEMKQRFDTPGPERDVFLMMSNIDPATLQPSELFALGWGPRPKGQIYMFPAGPCRPPGMPVEDVAAPVPEVQKLFKEKYPESARVMDIGLQGNLERWRDGEDRELLVRDVRKLKAERLGDEGARKRFGRELGL